MAEKIKKVIYARVPNELKIAFAKKCFEEGKRHDDVIAKLVRDYVNKPISKKR